MNLKDVVVIFLVSSVEIQFVFKAGSTIQEKCIWWFVDLIVKTHLLLNSLTECMPQYGREKEAKLINKT